jgi:hypothetical protein
VERLNIVISKRTKNMKKILSIIMILFCFNFILSKDNKCNSVLYKCKEKCNENSSIECIIICYQKFNECSRD